MNFINSLIAAGSVATKNFSIPDALLISLIGIVAVMTILVVLMLFISGLSKVVSKTDGTKFNIKRLFCKKCKEETVTDEPISANITAPGTSGSVKLYNVEERKAAMIMAIVADEMKTPLNELRFVSIKEVEEDVKNEIQG